MIKNIWFKISDKIRFLIIGSFNTACTYLLYALFCFFVGESFYQYALFLSWIITSFSGFFLYKYLVYESKGIWWKEYFKCCMTWSVSYFVNATILEILVSRLNINVYLAQIFACCFSAITTYTLFKFFAFKKGKKSEK